VQDVNIVGVSSSSVSNLDVKTGASATSGTKILTVQFDAPEGMEEFTVYYRQKEGNAVSSLGSGDAYTMDTANTTSYTTFTKNRYTYIQYYSVYDAVNNSSGLPGGDCSIGVAVRTYRDGYMGGSAITWKDGVTW
jgi:hypothetical protein